MASENNPLGAVLSSAKRSLVGAGLFSCAVNILMLTGPLFMLQVYDRVLASKSVPTLVALFALVAVLFLFMGFFDFIRSRVLSRIGYKLDVQLMALAQKSWIFSGLFSGRNNSRPVNDLTSIRQFFCSNGLNSLFDLPWMPFYLFIIFMLHVWLGLLVTAGAIIVVGSAIINELITKNQIASAASWEAKDSNFSVQVHRNAESVVAMGMIGNISRHWQDIRNKALIHSQTAGGRSEFITTLTKAVRMLIQSGILALGAYLAIFQEITPGTMIAASILAGRALAPVDQAIGNWKNFIRSRQAYARLSKTLALKSDGSKTVQLPAPRGNITVANISKFTDAGSSDQRPILQAINFSLKAGQAVGVIGPSGSGKSTLAKLLVGLWMPDKGSIRIDGARFDQWDRDEIGKHIGYLPQAVDLILGTIKENIARFDPTVTDDEIIAASQLAGVHELILKLPQGYSTDLAKGRFILSDGQSQRIALARAVLRSPALVVLDEPNANLDAEGDAALTTTIEALKEQGSTVVIMAHRPSAIAAADKILMLNDGHQMEFGDKEEVLKKTTRTVPTKARPGRLRRTKVQ
ncbi:MAG: type I secretion system permease/ATPase [Sneathiella sp.]